MNESAYSTGHSEQPSFSHCGEFIFFLVNGGINNPTIKAINLNSDEVLEVEIDSRPTRRITDIHVSSSTNHLAMLTSGGNEIGQIHVFEWKNVGDIISLEFKFSTENSDTLLKHIWGGFENDGVVYFRLRTDVSWDLLKHGFDQEQPETISNAGYFPDMLAKLDNTWIWRNKETTTKSKLNDNGDTLGVNIRSARLNSSGNLYAIIDSDDALAGRVAEISMDEQGSPRLHTDDTLFDEEWILHQLPCDLREDIPFGELHEFNFLDENRILLHFNVNGSSKLRLTTPNPFAEGEEIDLMEIEHECGGPVWINNMVLSPNKQKIILEVVNFSVSSHLWLIDINGGEPLQIVPPDTTFDTITQSLTFPTLLNGHGSCSMQYHKITKKESKSFKGTVIFFHGGPAVQTHVGRYFDRIVTLAEAGYQVIAPNPAGSLGRGGKHINLDNGKRRISQFNDQIIPFVKHIIDEHDSVYLFGGSYAGWLIAKILTHDIGERIRSAVVRNGVLNWQIFCDKTMSFRKRHRAWEYVGEDSFGFDNSMEILSELKPIPPLRCNDVLFFTGQDDIRVPPDSTNIFLEECGLNEDEIYNIHTSYPDEGHSIKNYANRIEIMEKTLELFSNT